MNRKQLAVTGAAVADAATLGLHWLYDQERILSLEPSTPEFHAHTQNDYNGVPGYFAHENRRTGQLSQYGEQMLTMLQSLSQQSGAYDKQHYQDEFVKTFGYGGTYVGYIDHATRDSLNNIAAAEAADTATNDEHFHGANDHQLPAVSKLPALVAAYHDDDSLLKHVESAIRVTNNNENAVTFGLFSARLLKAAIDTGSLERVVDIAKIENNPLIAPLMENVFNSGDVSTPTATAEWGMACDLDLGIPSIVHNLTQATSFKDAIRANIYAGGDSCGRSIMLGAILGSCFAPSSEESIPKDWLAQVDDRDRIAEHSRFLA